MNPKRVARILGRLLFVLAAAQLAPLLWCLTPAAPDVALGFVTGASTSALAGALAYWAGTGEGELYRRDGVIIVVGAWILASLSGAVPYLTTGAIASPIDALFESASGFTTTGASIFTNIEAVNRPVLFWRSLTQWLGGIGIVVLLVALLSELGPGARFLFRLEVPGPKAEVLHARVQETAAALFRIYLALTGMEIVLLLGLGLGPYDALTHTFSTVSTGGFSPYNDSVAHFSTPVQLCVTIFMLAAGANFSIYYGLLRRRDWVPLRDVELQVYGGVAVLASLAIAVDLADEATDLTAGPIDVAFQVVSIMTTTGFATADFDTWPVASRALLVGLMLLGGCAGSTAGGAKILRAIIAWKAAMREVRLTFNPNAVIAVFVGRQPVPEESIRSVIALLLLWIVAWAAGTLLLAVGETDLVTAATGALATLSNIGPGLATVGPTGNFAAFAPWQKLVTVVLMWLGRLEFFALLALFQVHFWRR